MEESFPHIKSWVWWAKFGWFVCLAALCNVQWHSWNAGMHYLYAYLGHAALCMTCDPTFCCVFVVRGVLPSAPPSVLLPVLQAKAKRGPPRQAKYAIHCINAMFSNRDTHFAQIFEVSHFGARFLSMWSMREDIPIPGLNPVCDGQPIKMKFDLKGRRKDLKHVVLDGEWTLGQYWVTADYLELSKQLNLRGETNVVWSALPFNCVISADFPVFCVTKRIRLHSWICSEYLPQCDVCINFTSNPSWDFLIYFFYVLLKLCQWHVVFLQPLHKSLDTANLEQLITPLTTLGHLAQLAPEQFAAPLKSLVANFIVKDLLMNDRVYTRIHVYLLLFCSV